MNNKVYQIYKEQVLGNKHQWTDKQLRKIEFIYTQIDENFFIDQMDVSVMDIVALPNFSWVGCNYFFCNKNPNLKSLKGLPKVKTHMGIARTNIDDYMKYLPARLESIWLPPTFDCSHFFHRKLSTLNWFGFYDINDKVEEFISENRNAVYNKYKTMLKYWEGLGTYGAVFTKRK